MRIATTPVTPSKPIKPSRNGHAADSQGPRFSVEFASDSNPIRRTIRNDDICVLAFDRPGSSANIFDRKTLTELREHLLVIAAQPGIQGLILASAKPSIFIAGADLGSMSQASPGEIRELVELGQQVMN